MLFVPFVSRPGVKHVKSLGLGTYNYPMEMMTVAFPSYGCFTNYMS